MSCPRSLMTRLASGKQKDEHLSYVKIDQQLSPPRTLNFVRFCMLWWNVDIHLRLSGMPLRDPLFAYLHAGHCFLSVNECRSIPSRRIVDPSYWYASTFPPFSLVHINRTMIIARVSSRCVCIQRRRRKRIAMQISLECVYVPGGEMNGEKKRNDCFPEHERIR